MFLCSLAGFLCHQGCFSTIDPGFAGVRAFFFFAFLCAVTPVSPVSPVVGQGLHIMIRCGQPGRAGAGCCYLWIFGF